MGLSCWAPSGGPGTSQGPPRALLATAAALVILLAATAPGAASKSNPLEEATEGCPEGWYGVHGGSGSSANRVCVNAEASAPYPPAVLRMLSTDVDREDCPEDFTGTILEREDTTVGVCLRVVFDEPDAIGPMIGADLSACELPEREGEDPVILVGDGGVGFCVIPIVEPGEELPTVDVSTEPCEPETTDPEVRVAGGGARVCADVYLFGIGNPQFNMLLSVVDTAFEVAPGYVPTP